jgi:hypothetical protein
MREGAFNFGPANANSQLLRNFKKYSKYMGETVIAFRGSLDEDAGDIFLGAFPTEGTLNADVHSIDMEYLGLSFWTIGTTALQLQHRSGKSIATVELYRESVKVKLTLSERTVVIPAASAERLQKTLPHCSF